MLKAPATSFWDWNALPKPRPLRDWLARKSSPGPHGYCSLIFRSCPIFELLHFRQMSHTVRWAPPLRPSVAYSLPHLNCHCATRASQRIIVGISAIGRSLVTIFGIKTLLCRLAAAISHSVPPSPRVPPRLLLLPLSSPGELWGESHRIPLLLSPCKASTPSPDRCLLALARPPPFSSTLHFSKAYSLDIAHCRHFANVLPTLSSFLRSDPSPWLLFHLLQNLHSSSPCRGLGDSVQKPSTTIRTLNHLAHFSLVHFFQLLYFIFSSSLLASRTISAWCIPILHEAKLSRNLRPAIHWPTNFCLHPFFLLLRFSLSFISFILCCCFISSSSVEPTFILFMRCKLYTLNQENCLAQQSSLHVRIRYLLLLRTRLHFKEYLCLCMLLLCCLPHCTCSGPLPQSSLQCSSNIHPHRVGPHPSKPIISSVSSTNILLPLWPNHLLFA